MKKWIATLCGAAFLASSVFVGCGPSGEETPKEEKKPTAGTTKPGTEKPAETPKTPEKPAGETK